MALGGKMVKRVKRGTKKIWHEKIERNKEKNKVKKKIKNKIKEKKRKQKRAEMRNKNNFR